MLIRVALGDITVKVKHDLKIDFYYVMTYFLFWNFFKKSFIATSRKVFWVFLNKEMRYKQNFDIFRVLLK